MAKTVRIGPDAGRFVRIASDRIEYEDESGETRTLDLPPADDQPDSRYVGFRWLDKAPWTVVIEGKEETHFVFESYEAAYEQLLIPLAEAGRDTMDFT